jgi:hypothetical protein
MAGLFTLTKFDVPTKQAELRERAATLEKLIEFEAKVTEWYIKTSRLDGTRAQRRAVAEKAAANDLGYSM